MKVWFAFLACLFLISCQTNMARQFEKIKTGDDKDTVLDYLGSPRHVTRMPSEDRWYYTYYNDDVRYQKEVHFKNGLVVYAGEKQKAKPEHDPVLIDNKNAEINAKFNAEEEKRKEDSKNAYKDYLGYQKKASKESEVKYIPDFEPVD